MNKNPVCLGGQDFLCLSWKIGRKNGEMPPANMDICTQIDSDVPIHYVQESNTINPVAA
jgi:hypothetical protein